MSSLRRIGVSLILASAVAGCATPAPQQPAPIEQAPRPAVALASSKTPAADSADASQDPDSSTPSHRDLVFRKAREHLRDIAEGTRANDVNRAQSASDPVAGAKGSTDPSGVDFVPHAALDNSAAAAAPAAPQFDPAPTTAPAAPSVQPPPPAITYTPPRTDVPFNKDTPAFNTPLIVGQPRPLPASDDMANKLVQQVRDYPQDIGAQLDLQILLLLQGQSVPQLQTIVSLPAEDRELLTAVLDGLTNFRNGVKSDSNMLLSQKIRPLIEMSDRLKTQAELSVPTVALCSDVKGFGVYEPFNPPAFPAGVEQRVIVYCEVENFSSMLDDQRRWETKLTQEVVLYQESTGEEAWRDPAPSRPIVDYSRNRRHDFFIVKMIRLPANLSPGRYLLKVSVVDEEVKRVAERSAALQINNGSTSPPPAQAASAP